MMAKTIRTIIVRYLHELEFLYLLKHKISFNRRLLELIVMQIYLIQKCKLKIYNFQQQPYFYNSTIDSQKPLIFYAQVFKDTPSFLIKNRF
jgi:hypothetical protein